MSRLNLAMRREMEGRGVAKDQESTQLKWQVYIDRKQTLRKGSEAQCLGWREMGWDGGAGGGDSRRSHWHQISLVQGYFGVPH